MTITPMPEQEGSDATTSDNLPAVQTAPAPISTELATRVEYAKMMAAAGMLPKQYQRQPANIMLADQYARDLQLPITTIFTGIHVIEGKPSASAGLIGGLVRRAGHKMRVKTGVDDKGEPTATVTIIRADDPEPEAWFIVTWTMAKARAADLAGKQNWKRYPQAMLKARAISECAREACEEALFGVQYTPEELGADVDEDGTPLNAGQRGVQADRLEAPQAAPAELPPVMAEAVAPAAPTQADGATGATEAPQEPVEPPAKARRTRAKAKPAEAAPAADEPAPAAPAEDEVVEAELVGEPVMEQKPTPAGPDVEQAYNRIGQALLVGEREELLEHYQGAKEAGLLNVDVKPALDRRERLVLGIRAQEVVPLQQALVACGTFVKQHGTSVADYLDANPEEGNTQGQPESSWGHPNPA